MFTFIVRAVCAVFVVLSIGAAGTTSASGAAVPAVAAMASEDPSSPARIVLYGDSLTMGFSGDWTWRYRLARGLTSSGTPFDFVGPRTDMLGYTTKRQFSQAYRDPDFDRDHASYAGMTFTRPVWTVSALANYYRPDVVVGFIGFNDLAQRLKTPAQLVDMWRTQIAWSRHWRPDISFVLVQQPDIWWRAMRVYNAGLVSLARELDTASSRVVVTTGANLDPNTDTYDTAHPSASGERKIADTVSEALAAIGVGTGSVAPSSETLADPVTGVWAPTPVVQVVDDVLTVTWDPVDYASAQDVYLSDVTDGPPATETSPAARVTGPSWSTPVVPGRTYQVSLAPVKGYLPMGTRSEPVVVDVPAPTEPTLVP